MRRKLILATLTVLVLAFLAEGCLAEGVLALNCSSGAALVSDSGEILTSVGEWEIMDPVTSEGRFIGTRRDGTQALLDENGTLLDTGEADGIWYYDDTFFFSVGDRVGVMDRDGKVLIEAGYDQMVPNQKGAFLALSSNPADMKADGVYLVDADGNEEPTGAKVLYGLGIMSEGFMTVTSEDGLSGYLNADGVWEIEPQFDYAGDFTGGSAEASIGSGSGLIDTKGNWIISPRYSVLSRSLHPDGPVICQQDVDTALVIDPHSGKTLETIASEEVYFSSYYDNGLSVIYLSDATWLIDMNGKKLLELDVDSYVDTGISMGDRAVVHTGDPVDDSVYLYDLKGNTVFGPAREIYPLGGERDSKKLFAVVDYDISESVDSQSGWRTGEEAEGTRRVSVIDEDGTFIIDRTEAVSADIAGEKYLVLERADDVTVTDMNGRTLFNVPYDMILGR